MNFFAWLLSWFVRAAPVIIPTIAKAKPGKKVVGGVIAAAVIFVGANEGLRNNAYRDSVGVPTICYGETLGVKIGQHKTTEECKIMFRGRLLEFHTGIHKYIKVPVSEKTDVALVSFAYNIGLGGFKRSTTLKLLNQGDYKSACKALMGWSKPPEIISRRKREVKLCLEGLE